MIKRRNVKTNGYEADKGLIRMVRTFEKAAERTFGSAEIDHFLYGGKLDMVRLVVGDGHYGDFNITAGRVSFNGHECSMEERRAFESLTYNDELYSGKLLEIANN